MQPNPEADFATTAQLAAAARLGASPRPTPQYARRSTVWERAWDTRRPLGPVRPARLRARRAGAGLALGKAWMERRAVDPRVYLRRRHRRQLRGLPARHPRHAMVAIASALDHGCHWARNCGGCSGGACRLDAAQRAAASSLRNHAEAKIPGRAVDSDQAPLRSDFFQGGKR